MSTEEEKKKNLNDLFLLYDKERKGKIYTKQLAKFASSAGLVVERKDLNEIINKYDKDCNGEMTFDDVYNSLSKYNVLTDEEIVNAFKVFDKDGTISKEELKYVMTNLGDKITEAEAEKLFSNFKIDNNGNINYKDFLSTYNIQI